MTQEKWERVKAVIEAVEDLTAGARQRALESLCGGDIQLRSEVDSLLAHESRIAIFEDAGYRLQSAGPLQIGPYRIERLLGAGGMGAVYLASRSDDQYSKQVAIKVIQSFGGPELERRFRAERQILASLEHPSIARLLDGGALADGRPYLVMEYVEGPPIDVYVKDRALLPREVLQFFLKVCSAVQFAHRNLIVHRDLKPSNILIARDGEPRLLDFGIAKILSRADGSELENTRPVERVMTPSSASPEQIAGGPITTATDVYALGVLLYRLLTGISPYADAPNFPADVTSAIQHYEPPPASSARGIAAPVARTLKGDIDTILAKALEKNPERRYRTVDEFAADIERYLDGRPILARSASWTYRAGRFVCRNRLSVVAASLLALAIASGVTGTVWYARRAHTEEVRADLRFQQLRRLSESLLFEFHDSIQNLPGATAARALMVRRALEYLDQLAAENASDPAVQRDLASAYIRIGGLLSGERSPHIGGMDATAKAVASYEKALAIRRALFQSNPADAGLRHDLLESLWRLAGAKQMQRRFDDAIALNRERLRIVAAAPDSGRQPELQYMLGTTYVTLADIFRQKGDLDQALVNARRSLEIRQALLDADPQSARARRVVGISHEYLGYVLSDRHEYSEAAEEHRRALADFQPSAAAAPDNVDLQRNLEVAEGNLCESLTRAGQVSNALEHCRRNVAVAEAMVRADRDNAQAVEDLGAAYATMGFALHTANQISKALEFERRGETEYRLAAVRDPDSVAAATAHINSLLEVARIEAVLHHGRACSYVREASDLLHALGAQSPADRTLASAVEEVGHVASCPSGPRTGTVRWKAPQ